MATRSLTMNEFYEFYKDQVLALAPELTDFSDGSLHDIIAGAFSASMNELTELTLTEFQKTFFDTATGSDLDILAEDHFGAKFARPVAINATGVITFSRANTDEGNVTIPVGTVVKTEKDSAGNEIRFLTTEEVILTGLTIDASIEADEAGSSGNLLANTLTVLESTLTDTSVTVNNTAAMAGGEDEQDDAEYRETIKNLIQSLAGATKEAIKGAILALPNIGFAELITEEKVVIEYDIGGGDIAAGAAYFRIPYPIVYVADENGNSSPSLIADANTAIAPVKACGVQIEVLGAIAISLNWTASLVLDAGGPNYSELQSDLTKIQESMTEYINTGLAIGEGFSRSSANAYILSIWGPAGTGDLTAFSTSTPAGDVSVNSNEKLIAGTMSIS
jgi:uncharacterized phage protein gp47/JayE